MMKIDNFSQKVNFVNKDIPIMLNNNKLFCFRKRRAEEQDIGKPAKRFKLGNGAAKQEKEKEEIEISKEPPSSPLQLSEGVRRQRQIMTERSPFRNLRKQILKKNQSKMVLRERSKSASF